MKAVVYDAPRSFSITEIPEPTPGPGEVLIKVIQTGICGTDLHIHEGDFYAAFPLIPGHEIVGTIAAAGDSLTSFQIGERVTVNPNISCGHCHACRSGQPLLCSNLKGIGTNWPGGLAEYLTAPAAYTYTVDGLDDDTAVATEPAACAMHGLETGRVRITHRFAINDYAAALQALRTDGTAHKIVITI